MKTITIKFVNGEEKSYTPSEFYDEFPPSEFYDEFHDDGTVCMDRDDA